MTILLAREGPDERVRRAQDAVERAFPGERVIPVDKAQLGVAGRRVVLPWAGRPIAVAPVVSALRACLRRRPAYWIDEHDVIGPCGVTFFARESARWFWYRLLDSVALGLGWLSSRRPGKCDAEVAGAGGGPIALVMPVLPDLSHTFMYREVVCLLELRPSCALLCLERGDSAIVHAEAAELMERTRFVPRAGITRHYATLLGWLLRAPRRAGAVFALYRDRPGGGLRDLLGKGPLREPRHPGNGFALASALRPLRPGHIHVYGSTYSANVAMEASLLLGVPFSISTYVDFDFDYAFKMLRQKHQRARFVRVCTAFCQRRMAQLLDLDDTDDVPVVFFGLNLDRWQERAAPPGEHRLMSAARLVEKKGLHLVPAALAKLRERGIVARWRVVGDGPERSRLEQLVTDFDLADQVEFVGPVPNHRVRELLLETDVAVLPCIVAADGERDGIPNFVTEPMALGIPVLTTPVSGIPELVRNGDTGFLATPGSADSLADRLEQILTDAEGTRAVAERGRAEVHATHDARRSARTLLRHIDGEPAAVDG